MESFATKASRSSLRPELILQDLAQSGQVDVLLEAHDSVGSTNDLVLAHRDEIRAGRVVAVTADEQVAGRGRLDRQWSSPWGAGVALSLGIDSQLVTHVATSVPLVVGLAVTQALAECGVTAQVKWPNDVLLEGYVPGKVAGVLVQYVNDVFVIGIGINCTLTREELPTEMATSLSLAGHTIAREELIARVIERVCVLLMSPLEWRTKYRAASATLGRDVTVTVSGDRQLVGRAVDVLPDGSLTLESAGETIQVTLGDVEQLRTVN
ncbi:MAG: biotin--[acetyl-CoA-carboxylase] ligase [Actinomycetes bacterium]